ncbi:MAG: hypothetical protein FWB71_06465, partial [Defluviitaleaceae bacterium]|nr:hypothetical protein [Defluviitaleaceae bacterium]
MKIRKLGYLLLIVPIMGLATNSWDRVELEERGFVITMAIDAAQPDEDSPADRIKLAMTLPGPRAVAEQEDDGVAIYAEQGQTIAQVKENICRKMSESLYFGHAKVLIFGEEILADGDLLARVLEDIAANSEINSKCIVLATGDPIEDILAAKPHGQNLVGLHISKYYEAIGGNGAGGVGKMDLEMLRDALNRDNSAIIPKISLCEDEEGLIFGGGAILADFELVRFAEDEELAGLLWFRRGGGEIRTICTNDEYI